MNRKQLIVTLFLSAFVSAAFGQGDRGTITGEVVDPTGAAIVGVSVGATNVETGNHVETLTTGSGNFTLPSLPVGGWDVLIEAKGFKKYSSRGTVVQVAQTTRLNVKLELGDVTDTVFVTAEAVLLKTENAEQAQIVAADQLAELPINWSVAFYNNNAVRNPLSIESLSPGISGGVGGAFMGNAGGGGSVNGAPSGSFRVLLEGQDQTSFYTPTYQFEQQPSVESLEEVTLQSSNYSAEFGQAQGGIFNFTTKSGTNQYHGGLFYYLTNEDINAHQPYTGARVPSRKNNYGGTFGGPLRIPHLYNGRNKTFFFFTFEGFHSVLPANDAGTYLTLPTANDRAGNFGYALGGRLNCGSAPCVDGNGNAVNAGQIFDPKSAGPNGVRTAFLNNTIPMSRMDPVAMKIQALFPQPTNGLNGLNYYVFSSDPRPQTIPSIKIDHNLSTATKVSFYGTGFYAGIVNTNDGLPEPLTQKRPDHHWAQTYRLSLDETIRPTVLLHLGLGFVRALTPDQSSPSEINYDAPAMLGLRGASVTPSGFPQLTGLANVAANGAVIGGLQNASYVSGVGLYQSNRDATTTITAVAALSWIKGAHSYKFGGNLLINAVTDPTATNTWGNYGFSANQTNQPLLQGTTSNGTAGLAYASFLIGLPNQAVVAPLVAEQFRSKSWGFYAEDTWKITHKLTLDYGLRYDLELPLHEDSNRQSTFSQSVLNPSAGNLPGGVIYQGFGPGTCNCKSLENTYPFAFGPRLAAAYQITPRTVIRAGWGFFYGVVAIGLNGNFISSGTGLDSITFASLGNGLSGLPNGLQGGLVYSPSQFSSTFHQAGAVPTLNPSSGLSNLNAPSTLLDRSGGRPPRVSQSNIALQREIVPGLTVEAAYVGNRGVWLQSSIFLPNAVTPAMVAAHGLSLSNPASLTLLNSQTGSAAVKAAGFSLPFATYPPTVTLANALRPMPQFNSNLTVGTNFGGVSPGAPTNGDTWYDSLQMKATARLRSGFTLLGTFTWAKSLTRLSAFDDFTKPGLERQLDPNSIPRVLGINLTYRTPHLTSVRFLGTLGHSKTAREIFSDWTVSSILRYQSGALITAPVSNLNLATYLAGAPAQYQSRVAGQSLYLTDPNGKIDPTKQLMLNPAAWTECGTAGTFGCGAPSYSDFRQRRTPSEQISAGRRFNLTENAYFEVRVEYFNAFNRLVFPNTSVGNPLTPATLNSKGLLTGGFGFVNINNIANGSARNGQIVARFAF